MQEKRMHLFSRNLEVMQDSADCCLGLDNDRTPPPHKVHYTEDIPLSVFYCPVVYDCLSNIHCNVHIYYRDLLKKLRHICRILNQMIIGFHLPKINILLQFPSAPE